MQARNVFTVHFMPQLTRLMIQMVIRSTRTLEQSPALWELDQMSKQERVKRGLSMVLDTCRMLSNCSVLTLTCEL